jgi:RHS repeat-associated protein
MVAPVAAVEVWVDGTNIGFATLGVQRPDVVSAVGNGDSRYLNSGFVFTGTVGNLSPGQHSVGVTIYDALGQHTSPASVFPLTVTADPSSLSGNLDGSNASANSTIPSGATLTASGWAAFPAASNCGVGQTVELWLGTTLIGQTQINGSRPDVANALGNQACLNTGWSISGSIASVPTGLHPLAVRVYDAAGGSNVLNSIPQIMVSPQGASPVSVATPLPTQYSWSLGFAPNGNVNYAYDSVNGNWAYLYDNLNRLVGAGSTNGNSLAWVYDSFGNMISQDVTGGSGISVQKTFAGNDNRVPFTCYDAAGNQLQDWGCYSTSQYTYDAENRLTSSGWGATSYLYDAEGQRIAKYSGNALTNVYVYDAGGQNIMELDGARNVLRSEVFAGTRHLATYNASGAIYALSDWLGTERARSNMTGTLCQTITSQPFGDGQQSSGTCFPSNRFFTGKERDTESGLDYFGARYYGSSIGRWMSPDWSAKEEPVPYAKLDNPQSLNLYSYVGNNPLSNIDPDGHACTAWYGNSGWTGSSGFCDRAAEYRRFDANPAINSRTRFFGAAAIVSNSLGDVGAWRVIVRPLGVSSQTGSILEGIGRTLQAFNEGESHLVATGALGSGPALDSQLVHNEQGVVQGVLNGLQTSDLAGYNKAIGEINGSLNGLATRALEEIAPSDRAYAGILAGVRKDLGRDINFANQSDREAIGNAQVQALRKQQQ